MTIDRIQRAIEHSSPQAAVDKGNFSIQLVGLKNFLLQEGFKEELILNGERFTLKQSLHVTVAARSIGVLGPTRKEEAVDKLYREILLGLPPQDLTFQVQPQFHLLDTVLTYTLPSGVCETSHRKTIIVELACEALTPFWQQLRSETALELPEPPYHITLYARAEGDHDKSHLGIAVTRASQLMPGSSDCIASPLPDAVDLLV